jgi:hypothetical protein
MKLDTDKIIGKLTLLEAQLEALKIECCLAREELERFHAPTPPSGKNKRFNESAEKVLTNRNASMFKKKLQK